MRIRARAALHAGAICDTCPCPGWPSPGRSASVIAPPVPLLPRERALVSLTKSPAKMPTPEEKPQKAEETETDAFFVHFQRTKCLGSAGRDRPSRSVGIRTGCRRADSSVTVLCATLEPCKRRQHLRCRGNMRFDLRGRRKEFLLI